MNKRDQIISRFSQKPAKLSNKQLEDLILSELKDVQPIPPIPFRKYMEATFNISTADIRNTIARLHVNGSIDFDDNLSIIIT